MLDVLDLPAYGRMPERRAHRGVRDLRIGAERDYLDLQICSHRTTSSPDGGPLHDYPAGRQRHHFPQVEIQPGSALPGVLADQSSWL